MRSKSLFVAAAAIIVLSCVSCNWFRTSSSDATSLSGDWQVVNIADSSLDSSKNALGLLVLSMAAKDSLQLSFSGDSSFKFLNATALVDSGRYVFNEKLKTLSLYGNDTAAFSLNYISKDSLHFISPKDSLHYSLRKLK